MAHIPMDDVRKLWNEAPHNWSGLAQYAESEQGKKNGIADYLMIELPRVARGMGNGSFPDSEQKLFDVLNEKLKDMPHHTSTARQEMGSKG